jgi:hypothetical protein
VAALGPVRQQKQACMAQLSTFRGFVFVCIIKCVIIVQMFIGGAGDAND